MIQFDGCIFFKWVGEKPPTSQLIISKLVHIWSLGFQDASLPSSMCEISLLSSLQTWQSFFEACEKPGWRQWPTKKDFTTKKHEHVKGDEHRFFCLTFDFLMCNLAIFFQWKSKSHLEFENHHLEGGPASPTNSTDSSLVIVAVAGFLPQ